MEENVVRKLLHLFVGLAVLILSMPFGTARAQPFYVSGTGSGTACTLVAPCTFEQAFSSLNTNSGGVLSCINPVVPNSGTTHMLGAGSYTIDCPGTVWTSGGNTPALSLNSSGNGTVIIRNMTLDGSQALLNGIQVGTGATTLILENCLLQNWPGLAIAFTPNSPATLIVKDSVFQSNGSIGANHPTGAISIVPASGGGSVRVVIERTQIVKNNTGIFTDGTGGMVLAEIKDSTVSNNPGAGIMIFGGNTASVVLNRSSVDHNGTGVVTTGAGAFVLLRDSTVMWNSTGLFAANGGLVLSYQNNVIAGNPAPGVTPVSLSSQ
jgi:hypothetical protein